MPNTPDVARPSDTNKCSTRRRSWWTIPPIHDYFPRFGPNNTWIPGLGPFQEPESRHGAPMAALWRAFLILGNPLC
jgi:hypothetical protein